MTAVETLEQLLKLGITVKEAFDKSGTAGTKPDWTAFLKSPEFQQVAETVGKLIASLTNTDLEDTISAIESKQKALLGGRTVAELPTDKLIQ